MSSDGSFSSDQTMIKFNDKSKRLIVRQRLAIQGLVLLCLLVMMLFVWQLSVNLMNRKNSGKKNQSPVSSNNLLKLEERPCPVVPSKELMPKSLPSSVSQAMGMVHAVFKSLSQLSELDGLVASLVYKNKVIWKKSHGVKDKEAPNSISPDENTVFKVASVSKILTVLFVFNLLDSGKISSLDDTLNKYEPRFSIVNRFNSDQITIRQILTHTSGLPREVPCGNHWSNSATNLCPVNTTFVLEKLKTMSLKSPPGQEPNYSNLGFALLARILAQRFANGKYEDWVMRNILVPLQMKNSGFNVKSVSSNRAVSYGANGKKHSEVDWGWAAPAFQLYSTAADLSKLMMGLFHETPIKIVRSDLLTQILRPNFVYPDGQTMVGLGWEMKLTGSYILVSKSGIVPGYSAGFSFYPKLQLGSVVLMSGREMAPTGAEVLLRPVARRLVSYLIKHIQLEVPSNPKKYIGAYKLTSRWIGAVVFNITLQDNVLQLHQMPGFPPVSYLNYIEDNVLELVYKPGYTCPVYGMGQNHERLHFEPRDSSGKAPGFQFGSFQFIRIYGKSPSKAGSVVDSKESLSSLV